MRRSGLHFSLCFFLFCFCLSLLHSSSSFSLFLFFLFFFLLPSVSFHFFSFFFLQPCQRWREKKGIDKARDLRLTSDILALVSLVFRHHCESVTKNRTTVALTQETTFSTQKRKSIHRSYRLAKVQESLKRNQSPGKRGAMTRLYFFSLETFRL